MADYTSGITASRFFQAIDFQGVSITDVIAGRSKICGMAPVRSAFIFRFPDIETHGLWVTVADMPELLQGMDEGKYAVDTPHDARRPYTRQRKQAASHTPAKRFLCATCVRVGRTGAVTPSSLLSGGSTSRLGTGSTLSTTTFAASIHTARIRS